MAGTFLNFNDPEIDRWVNDDVERPFEEWLPLAMGRDLRSIYQWLATNNGTEVSDEDLLMLVSWLADATASVARVLHQKGDSDDSE